MAFEHYKVFLKLGEEVQVFGNSKLSSNRFSTLTGANVIYGNYLTAANFKNINKVVIATPMNTLFDITMSCINLGIDEILVEKPLFIDSDQLERIRIYSDHKIFIAFNRRFYSSVSKLLEIANSDGGIRSCSFSFDERIRTWEYPYNSSSNVECRLPILSQSSHLLNLVFYLIGLPLELNLTRNVVSSNLNDFIFYGSGLSEKQIPFSFLSDWSSPGSWKIEVNTKNKKMILNPLEKLSVYEYNLMKSDNGKHEWSIDSTLLSEDPIDIEFKPGLFKQNESFLNSSSNKLMTIKQFIKEFEFLLKF